MRIIRLPVDSSHVSINLLGGKAANLNQLMTAEFPVPPTFVVTTEAYQDFMRANDLDQISTNWQTAPTSDKQIVQCFLEAKFPEEISSPILMTYHELGGKEVAIRSSATSEDLPAASFAGQLDSFLNVLGDTAVLHAVKMCWASLWKARAVAYRRRQAITAESLQMAVIMQQMIPADSAGVMFTANPLAAIKDTLVIEAVHGLAEKLVSGAHNPDRYVVNDQGNIVEEAHIQGEKPILITEQIRQLTQTGLAAATLFRSPLDIEWAIADGQLYLLQSRLITTLQVPDRPVPPVEVQVPGDDDWLAEEMISHPFDLWTRANFGEVLPYPVSPLTLSSLQMIGNAAEVQLSSGEKIQMARRLYGRIYANEGGMRQFVADLGLPTSFIDATWGSRRPDLPPKAGFRPWRLLYKIPLLFWQNVKARRQNPPQEALLPKDEQKLYKQIDAWATRHHASNLSTLSAETLWMKLLEDWEPRRVQMYQRHTTVSTGAFLSFAPLEWMVKKWGKNVQTSQKLIAGLNGLHAAEMGPTLQRIAQTVQDAGLADLVLNNPPQVAWDKLQAMPEAVQVREAMEQFLTKHGHRCPAEPEILLPRWAEAPEQVISLVAGYVRHTPSTIDRPAEISHLQAQIEIEKQLDPIRRFVLRRVLKQAQNQVRRRDNSRHYMAKIELPRRQLFVELGRRWQKEGLLAAADDIFFLTHAEIEAQINTKNSTMPLPSLSEKAGRRRKTYDYWNTYPAPDALDCDLVPLLPPQLNDHNGLRGVPASSGIATGPVRIIHQPNEVARLQAGDILLTLATDPGWTPVFPLVAGMILVYGGQLSHGAIVAREYGVPAVVNVPEALSRLQEGMVVTVDGKNGRIFW